MTGARRVRRLRLAARDEALIGRGRILIEDALRTASLAEADGGRVYAVRRLELGVIDPARPPGVVAQAIEQRFALLRVIAVHAQTAHAQTGSVVYFHDAVEPFTLLARRLLSGPPPDEWFWPLAVAGFSPHGPREEALRVVLMGALSTPGRGAAVADLVAALSDTEIDHLCGALRRADGEMLLTGFPGSAADLPISPPEPSLLLPWRRLLSRWMGRWGARDPRTAWLAAAAICAAAPARATDPALMRRAAGTIEALLVATDPADARTRPGPDILRRRARADAVADPDAASTRAATNNAAQPGARAHVGVKPDRSPVPPPTTASEHAARAATERGGYDQPVETEETPTTEQWQARRRAAWEGILLPTAAGGLLFVVHPLTRLGFPQWLDADPTAADGGIAARLLRHVALRAGIRPDDPGLSPWGAPDEPAPSSFEQRALDLWCGKLARWTRQCARLRLRAVVRRRARVVATRTHVDVVFSARDADIRVRAAGLDIDPGWVPWLGRVVQFHYTDAASDGRA